MKIKHLPLKINLGVAMMAIPTALISCNSNSDFICSWTKGTDYVPMEPRQFDQPFTSDDDITKSYQKDISENKLIFSDEKIYYFYKKNGEICDINTVSCNTKSISAIEHIDQNASRDIFRINIEINIDAVVKTKTPHLVFNNRKLKFNNIPIHAIFNANLTKIKVDVQLAFKDTLWSVNFPELKKDSQGNMFIGDENVDYNTTNLSSLDADIRETLNGLMQATIDFDSNYYSNAEFA